MKNIGWHASENSDMYYVYILESEKDGKLYKGFTRDLKKRIEQHNSGENRSTNQRGPWKLIHYEAFINKEDALERQACTPKFLSLIKI